MLYEDEDTPDSLVVEKDYTGSSLKRVNKSAFNCFLKAEKLFRAANLKVPNVHKQLLDEIMKDENVIELQELSVCHDIIKALMKVFLRIRLKVHGGILKGKAFEEKRKTNQEKKIKNELASKSMAMRRLAANLK